MKTLVIDRSTEHTSVVAVSADGTTQPIDLGIWNDTHHPTADTQHPTTPSSLSPNHSSLITHHSSLTSLSALNSQLSTILVGTGPGSFAGIRSALAFAQGCAVGCGCEVLGLTSAAAYARQDEPVAVVGDARRGKFWIALFDGYRLVTDIFQVERDELGKRVPRGIAVLSPDWKRISAILTDVFGDVAAPAPEMDSAALWRVASANPSLLKREPLPIYLNPAVRD